MDAETLRGFLRQSEGPKLDFKREFYKVNKTKFTDGAGREREWNELIKDILALANGNVGYADQPAYLIIGVDDELRQDGSRELYSLVDDPPSSQQILDKLNSKCDPPIPELKCEATDLDGFRVLIIQIPPSPHLHETTQWLKTPDAVFNPGTVLIRRGESVFPASASERQAIIQDKQRFLSLAGKLDRPTSTPRSLTADLVQRHRDCLARVQRYERWADRSLDDSYIGSQAVKLPLFVSPYESISSNLEEIQACIQSHERLVILGEPGMGKTVALERAAWELAAAKNLVVPVFVPIIQYEGDLVASIIDALNETGLLTMEDRLKMESLIRSHRCVFLFDGLNEVPGNYRERLYSELATFLRSHPQSSCIVTSRSQDDLWRRFHSRELIEHAVVIQRITEQQIMQYLQAHLGTTLGMELFDRLNSALRGLARIPLLLWLIKEAGLAGEELPGNRGELFDRFVRRVLKREQKQPELVTVPLEQKIQALSHLAFHLQSQHRLACSRNEAVAVIGQSMEGPYEAAIVAESMHNGLLMGDDQLHFMHQSILEYFAALRVAAVLETCPGPENDESRLGIRTMLSEKTINRQLRKWAKDDWWAEVLIQLSGLTNNPMFVVKQILLANPWLAYWCSIEGKTLTAELQSQVEQQTVARLFTSREEERLRVVRELARMENPRTIKHLILALGDRSTNVRMSACETLARLGEPSVEALLDLLPSADAITRFAATRTLGMIWNFHEIVDLGADDQGMRRQAADLLGNLGDDRAVLPLAAALNDTGAIRMCAAESLGKLGDARAVAPLIAALEQSYEHGRSEESALIAQALSMLGQPPVEPLLLGIRSPDGNARKRALVALSKLWRLPAIAALASSEPELRRQAAERLGQTGDDRVVDPLLSALNDQDQLVRWETTQALGRLLNHESLYRLGHPDDSMRQAAVQELVRKPDARFVEPLIAAMRDRDPEVCELARDSLSAFGAIAVPHLAKLLRSEDHEVQRIAARALSEVNCDEAIEALEFALRDERSWIREIAASSLVRLGDRAVPVFKDALMSQDDDLRQISLFSLRRIGTVRAFTAIHFRLRGR